MQQRQTRSCRQIKQTKQTDVFFVKPQSRKIEANDRQLFLSPLNSIGWPLAIGALNRFAHLQSAVASFLARKRASESTVKMPDNNEKVRARAMLRRSQFVRAAQHKAALVAQHCDDRVESAIAREAKRRDAHKKACRRRRASDEMSACRVPNDCADAAAVARRLVSGERARARAPTKFGVSGGSASGALFVVAARCVCRVKADLRPLFESLDNKR